MRQALLAFILILVPVTAFTAVEIYLVPHPAVSLAADKRLGDLGPFEAITADVQTIAASGDLGGAKARIKDLETAWDDAEATMRPLDAGQWGTVDDAIDAALHAVRAGTPEPATVSDALAALQVTLADPTGGGAGVLVAVSGIAVTDATGHPLPCEQMIGTVRTGVAAHTGALPEAEALLTKALERCNADDDRNANQFSAQALALLAKS